MENLVEEAPLLKYDLAVAWYELILNREKLYLHLKKLRDDVSGKKLVCCSRTTFCVERGLVQ